MAFDRRNAALAILLLVFSSACFAAATEVSDGVYMARGISNSYLIVTPDGNVVIDTGAPGTARKQYDALRAVDDGPVRYVVLTHAHIDHTAGIDLWNSPSTRLIAHRTHADEVAYQERLGGFFARRNAAQFGGGRDPGPVVADGSAARVDIVFDAAHEFRLGGLTFRLVHTPGETGDHVSVWIPELRAAFIGDNYYDSFPNISTLRGTKPRWALDYVDSLDRVIGWRPEVVLAGHVAPLEGSESIAAILSRYRDAILYVHDATVAGMNAGKHVDDLMRDVSLPAELDLGEKYGRISWSVRGIYQGYVGWFDERPESMYPADPAAEARSVLTLAGGSNAFIDLARARQAEGLLVDALRLTSFVVDAEPANRDGLTLRIEILQELERQAGNFNERAWLRNARMRAQQSLQAE